MTHAGAFDDQAIFTSGPIIGDGEGTGSIHVKKQFKEFVRGYHEGDFQYKYKEQLLKHYRLRNYWLEVLLDDLVAFNDDIADKLQKSPTEMIPLFEEAAKEVADEITRPRDIDESEVQPIQVMIKSEARPTLLRDLKSEYISRLVKVPGIVIAASNVRAKATQISLQCRGCKETHNDLQIRPGLEGFILPRKCNTDQTGRTVKCPIDPFFIIPEKCKCVDFQTLKLQELPEDVPHGEMPRHLQLYCDRYLCEKVVPGNRVTLVGIYSIKKISKPSNRSATEGKTSNVGIRSPYLRVVGIHIETEGPGRSGSQPFTAEEEELFRNLASSPNIYERIAKSIAPSIYGCENIKKAVACLLFSGSRKKLPDGDINVLLLGDPGTAKSQLLKFVEKVAPIAVYTSGKGSSAAGLTASVIRDPASKNFIMEGGAMVLADGGVVCIDEFDKMREDDRVAIHEAMEQQTISIAKAGITTTLNSRCSVLAAANSVYGRWDETKADQNIDFMPTILARFDMIFIVKDEYNEKRDLTLAQHVVDIHMNARRVVEESVEGELSLKVLKKFIAYCRSSCGPRISETAGNKLVEEYVKMRNGHRDQDQVHQKSVIPITVRQLEATIRISESLAKMQLLPFATEKHVAEALRLFQVSTLEAAQTGDLAGAEGFTTEEEHQMLTRIEKQIKRRFPMGSQIAERTIVQDLVKQNFPERAIQKVLHCMLRKGEIQYRMQRKMLYRLK